MMFLLQMVNLVAFFFVMFVRKLLLKLNIVFLFHQFRFFEYCNSIGSDDGDDSDTFHAKQPNKKVKNSVFPFKTFFNTMKEYTI